MFTLETRAGMLGAVFALLLAPCAATRAADAPAIFFTDVEAGPTSGGPGGKGVPIAIYGKGFGATRGTSKVTIGGVEVASYLTWGQANANNPALDMIVVQPGAISVGGAVVVNVGGLNSNAEHTFAPSGGKVYYVAPSGSDGSPCTELQPCATILHVATGVMVAGDALLVRGGNLNDNEIWIRDDHGHSGQLGKPKIIRNYPGEAPLFALTTRPVILDANYITLSGFHLRDRKAIGVGRENLRGQRVYNNRFRGAIDWDAIGTHGNDIVLAGNDCDITASTVGTQGHCYYISHGSNIKLLYNIARGAPGYGIHIFDQRRSAADIRRVISNVLVEGNLLAAQPQRSGLIVAMGDEDGLGNHIDGVTIRNNVFVANNFAGIAIGDNVRNTKVYHNTFYQNGRQGLTIYDTPTVNGVEVVNNLFDQSTNANCRANCSWYPIAHVQKGARAQNVVLANNFYAPAPAVVLGTVDAAPASGAAGFVNASAGDYRLASGSAALDKGRALSAVMRDFDGRSRSTATPDPGAFEAGAGAPPPPSGTTLSASPSSVASGSNVTVAWSGIATPSANNWIGLYQPGAPSTSYIDLLYVNCTKTPTTARGSGNCSFAIPSFLAGTFEFRLHRGGSWTVLATSNPITATGGAGTTLSATPTTASPGSTVTVSWDGIAVARSTNWIGLHRLGSNSAIDWLYVSCSKTASVVQVRGSCPFVLPSSLAAGTYEFHLHAPSSWTVLARSAALVVR